MRIDYILDSFKGTNKEENKDFSAIIRDEEYFLIILFDGVSSAKNSKLGIKKSINYINENYKKYRTKNNFRLRDLMFDVNNYLSTSDEKELYTTYLSIFFDLNKNIIKFSNLGDTRLYGISNKYIKQYSEDHRGKISNTITKCLGIKELIIDDFNETEINKSEHRLLIATDGLYNLLEKDKIKYFEFLNFSLLSNIKKRLEKEVSGNNTDDATYILINTYV
jgi:serine/threonine protein phosphatase PrpC